MHWNQSDSAIGSFQCHRGVLTPDSVASLLSQKHLSRHPITLKKEQKGGRKEGWVGGDRELLDENAIFHRRAFILGAIELREPDAKLPEVNVEQRT